MQTLCKPSRRVYDTKAIEACHDDGTDEHSYYHAGATVGIGVGMALVPTPAKVAGRVLLGGSAAFTAYVTEAEEAIAHTAENLVNAISDMDLGGGGSGGTTGSGTADGTPAAQEVINIDPITGQNTDDD